MRSITIERKQLPTHAAVMVLYQVLVGRTGTWCSVADAAVLSGLPLADAEAALLELAARNPAQIRVGDAVATTGEPVSGIEVRFERLQSPRPGPIRFVLEWLRTQWHAWSDELDVLFAMLFVVPFLAVGITSMGMLVAATETAGPEAVMHFARLMTIPWLVVGIVWAGAFLLWMVPWAFVLVGLRWLCFVPMSPSSWIVTFIVVLVAAAVGMRLLRAVVRRRTPAAEQSFFGRLWRSFRGFVLGPRMPKHDALADERHLTALLRNARGVVTTSDLMGAFGWTPDEAQRQIVRILIDYGGDVTVAEDGSIVWVFPAFAQGAPEPDAEPYPGFVVPVPAPHTFFASSRRFLIAVLVLFVPLPLGLAMVDPDRAFPDVGAMLQASALDTSPSRGKADLFADVFAIVGLWPLVVVGVILAVRLVVFVARRRHRERFRRFVDILHVACARPNEGRLTMSRADLRTVALLEGEIDEARGLDPRGRVYVRFPKYSSASASADELRQSGQLTPSF